MALNTCGMLSRGIKIACFTKKTPNFWGLRSQNPKASCSWGYRPGLPSAICLTYTCVPNMSPNLDICTFLTLVNHTTASGLPLNDIFAPQKVSVSKISDDVIACDLRFGPPQSKILATPIVEVCLCVRFFLLKPFNCYIVHHCSLSLISCSSCHREVWRKASHKNAIERVSTLFHQALVTWYVTVALFNVLSSFVGYGFLKFGLFLCTSYLYCNSQIPQSTVIYPY